MEFEADRMTGLVLTDEIVAPERDVVLEERRMHCDADPSAQLNEAVQAALFTHHPYGTPIIGWGHEIESLDREDALAYYARFYTPENAILIVAGDTDAEEVRRLAEQHYGKIRPRGAAPERHRPHEPAPVARRLVVVNDEKVEQPSWQRCYLAPSHRTAAPGESEALDVLAHLLGGGQTSLLYRKLVLEDQAGGRGGRLLHGLGARRDAVLSLRHAGSRRLAARTRRGGRSRARDRSSPTASTAKALERAKTRLVADAIYAQDSQATLARWYGASLATGQTIARRPGMAGAHRGGERRRACSRRRASGSTAAARSPAFCLPAEDQAA